MLQFEGLMDLPGGPANNLRGSRRKKSKGGRGGGGRGGMDNDGGSGDGSGGSGRRKNRPQALAVEVDEIINNADRYNQWWTGPLSQDTYSFKPAVWGAQHQPSANAIFTTSVTQGGADRFICSSPNDLKLFFGTARKVFSGDIVLALETGYSDTAKAILKHYNIIVYEIPHDLCSKATRSIFCGSEDERVPASVFRYYFYELWAVHYSVESLLMLADFRDIVFQSDPFEYHRSEWYPEHQLVVFQEFHPNMVSGSVVSNPPTFASRPICVISLDIL